LNPLSLEGRSLNHYVIGPLIGTGGMAEVYRAHDTKLGRDVAIKILHEVGSVDRERLEAVYREARVLAALNHPNIASIYGIEEGEGVCGLVLELVEGETLSDRLRRGPLAVADALHLSRQIIAGLGAAHARGIIHRDLKPSNIKLTPQGTVKLVDFGIAKLMRSLDLDESLQDVSRVGVVVGTVAYMSPEQARGKPIDVRTDVWAFGCVLYEMLTGRAAFRGDSPTDIVVKIASEEPDWTSIGTIVHADSPDVHRLIRKCMQKDPNMRYASVGEVAGYLEAVGSESLVSPLQVPQPVPPKPAEAEFTLPRGPALPLFMLAQVGYLALYAATLVQFADVARILADYFDVPELYALVSPAVLAMCGIAIRIYLISAVGWRHPLAGKKFTLLFPMLLIFDGVWAASPLLIWHTMDNFGLAFAGVALLAYVPFAQRTLMHAIYPERKTS
jgi:serine/threonine protein kinase